MRLRQPRRVRVAASSVARGQEPGGGGTGRPALRYRLLETIRLFAAERLAPSGGIRPLLSTAAHCAHFLSVAETASPHLAGPTRAAGCARLRADHAEPPPRRRARGCQPGRHLAGPALRRRLVAYFSLVPNKEAFALLVPALASTRSPPPTPRCSPRRWSCAENWPDPDRPAAPSADGRGGDPGRQPPRRRPTAHPVPRHLCVRRTSSPVSRTGHLPLGRGAVDRARRSRRRRAAGPEPADSTLPSIHRSGGGHSLCAGARPGPPGLTGSARR